MPINTFANETEYNSHIKSTTESEVSLITNNNEVKYDGVNVEVTEPKFGDAVYVDNVVDVNGKYGKHFIDGESLNPSLLPNGYTPVGVVVANEGNKILIVYYKGFNNGDNTSEFQKGALFELDAITDGTQRSIVFQQVASTSPYGNVTIGTFTHSCSTQEQLAQELDTWLRANPGGSASGCYTYNWHCEYRENYQGIMKPFVICDTVSDNRQFTTVVASGATVVINSDIVNTMPIITSYKRNNGANSERFGCNYERLLEYYNTNTTIANPTSNIPINSANEVVSRTQFNENQYCVLLRNEYGTFENYIKSVMLNSLTIKRGLGIEFNKSLEWTKTLAVKKYNNLSGVETFEFPIHKWAQSININSEGFEAGTWYLPNVLEMYKINKDITYGLSGITTSNCDLLNKTLNKLGGNLLNITQYKWINARRHSNNAWLLITTGNFYANSIQNSIRAVACQFLLKK